LYFFVIDLQPEELPVHPLHYRKCRWTADTPEYNRTHSRLVDRQHPFRCLNSLQPLAQMQANQHDELILTFANDGMFKVCELLECVCAL
jgi:hypothetical protein